MSLPPVVSHEEWRGARKELLVKEKELTRQRDALNVQRRMLPMVKIEKDYVFTGAEGQARLIDLFGEHRQLFVQHFMFDPEWEDGCPSCSAGADENSEGLRNHLHARNTTFAAISRAPIEKIERYKAKKGWTFPWYSSFGSEFNYDFHVTLDPDVAPVEYNFRDADELEASGAGFLLEGSSEQPGHSVFLRDGDVVYHAYSMYARGAEQLGGSYYFLDLTPLGRQEDWEEPKGRAQGADDRGANPNFQS